MAYIVNSKESNAMETRNEKKEHIEFIMKHYSLDVKKFSEKINIPEPTVQHILVGRNKPSLTVIEHICIFFPEISPAWILLEQGEPFSNPTSQATPALNSFGDTKERIEFLMNQFSMNAKKFSKKINIHESTILNILNRRNSPSLGLIEQICLTFTEISATWMLLGQGEPFISTASQS